MEKVNERLNELTGFYFKEYKDENIDSKQFVQQLKESNIGFDMIWVTEDVDRDMKNVSGTYGIDSLVEKYDYIVNNASSFGDLYFTFFVDEADQKYQIFLYPKEDNHMFYLQSKDPSIELTDVLQKKSELEKGRSK